MAKMKHLRKHATKFRKTEPALHATVSKALSYMAYFIKKTGALEVVVEIQDGLVVDAYEY